jgi:hypothetical protein
VKFVFSKGGANARVLASTGSAGSVSAQVTAKKGGKVLVLASGGGSARATGETKITLHEHAGATRGLGSGTIAATLEVKFTPSAGGKTVKATRKIKYEVGG